jgi:hypothetical protein
VGEHEEEQGHTGEEDLSEHGIAIATGATHWHCTDAEPEETSAHKPLSNSKAWGYTMAAVLIGSVGCVVILVRVLRRASLARLRPVGTWITLCAHLCARVCCAPV